jgi:hypothetical protein
MPATKAQVSAGSHVFFAATPTPQHGWPSAPQVWQLPVRPTAAPMQALPSRQVCALPALQQGWPLSPQVEQVVIPTKQLERAAVQVELSQHVWSTLPHLVPMLLSQEPLVHVP